MITAAIHRRARDVRARRKWSARGDTSRAASRRNRDGKMGKSLKSTVTPDDIYRDYGADTFASTGVHGRSARAAVEPRDITGVHVAASGATWSTRTPALRVDAPTDAASCIAPSTSARRLGTLEFNTRSPSCSSSTTGSRVGHRRHRVMWWSMTLMLAPLRPPCGRGVGTPRPPTTITTTVPAATCSSSTTRSMFPCRSTGRSRQVRRHRRRRRRPRSGSADEGRRAARRREIRKVIVVGAWSTSSSADVPGSGCWQRVRAVTSCA